MCYIQKYTCIISCALVSLLLFYYYYYKYEPTITVIKAKPNAHFEAQFNSAYAPFGILGINNFSKSVSKGGDFLFI